MFFKNKKFKNRNSESDRKSESDNRSDVRHDDFLSLLTESSPDVIFLLDRDGRIEYISPSIKEISGYHPSETEGRHFSKFVPFKELPKYLKSLAEIFYNKRLYSFETCIIHAEGHHVPVEFTGRMVKKDGTYVAQGAMRDITLRKKQEEELQKYRDHLETLVNQRTVELQASEQRYRFLAENISDVIWTIDADKQTTFISPSVERFLGYSVEEAKQKKIFEILTPESYQRARKAIKSQRFGLLARASSKTEPLILELECIRRDSTTVWCEASIVLLSESKDKKKETLIVTRDISDRKKAEEEKEKLQEQLIHAQKMEAIGTLAGGIAHDINNVLTMIMGCSSVIKDSLSMSDAINENIDDIIIAAQRGATLTKNLLGFARKGRYRTEAIDVNQTVNDVEQILRRTISKKVTIVKSLEADIRDVEGDPNQIAQVLINLCLNAADAISVSGHGQLKIITRNAMLDQEDAVTRFKLKPGHYVKLEVSDNGIGIDKESRQRVFEPFYTTKPVGKGTGLGLAMVYGTVRNHGGFVDLQSEKGQGTTMTVYLPAILDRSPRIAAEPVKEEPRCGTGTVLVVDDEPIIRSMSKRLLGRLGYDLLLAENGEAAVQIFKENHAKIDLVLLDLIMPYMDGHECFHKLIEIDPDARILICTGHADRDEVEGLLRNGALGLIEKPFDIHILGDAVASAIRGRKNRFHIDSTGLSLGAPATLRFPN